MIKVGDKAIDFTLPSHNEGELNLNWYQGRKNVVLAFYPGDWTPVCANQIPSYQKLLDKFEEFDTQLLAISVDSIPCHRSWVKSLGGITFPILSDYYPHGEVAQKYGVLNSRGYSDRVIIVIDKQGNVVAVDDVGFKNQPDNEKLLKILANL